MKLVRSDSPEVARAIASSGARARERQYPFVWGCAANILGLSFTLTVSRIVSAQGAVWLSVPVFLGLNGFVLWRIYSRRWWVLMGCDDQVYIRLFGWLRRGRGEVHESEILVLEASEIGSMSARTVEVFLNGPRSRTVDWLLVIEPSPAVAEDFSRHVRPLLRSLDPGKWALVGDEEGRLTIEWKWWCPALQVFLRQMIRDCPSIVIAPEDRSELDLNEMWRGLARNPNKDLSVQERQNLVLAKRLGFYCNLAGMLCRYKHISRRKAGAYLAELEREEAGTGQSSVQR